MLLGLWLALWVRLAVPGLLWAAVIAGFVGVVPLVSRAGHTRIHLAGCLQAPFVALLLLLARRCCRMPLAPCSECLRAVAPEASDECRCCRMPLGSLSSDGSSLLRSLSYVLSFSPFSGFLSSFLPVPGYCFLSRFATAPEVRSLSSHDVPAFLARLATHAVAQLPPVHCLLGGVAHMELRCISFFGFCSRGFQCR